MRRSASARPDLRRSPRALRPAKSAGTRRPPRRTQESRSKAAREKLLRATIELLQERGYHGLTTKEVAARAAVMTSSPSAANSSRLLASN